MARISLDAEELDALQEAMEQFGEGAAKEINDVLQDAGAREIKQEIQQLLPVSGRSWKKKKPAAKGAQPFTQESGMLEVTVKTVNNYHYLYFPDDGSNTKKHAGNQQFMLGGAANASEKIVEQCIGRLAESLT